MSGFLKKLTGRPTAEDKLMAQLNEIRKPNPAGETPAQGAPSAGASRKPVTGAAAGGGQPARPAKPAPAPNPPSADVRRSAQAPVSEESIEQMLERINRLTAGETDQAAAKTSTPAAPVPTAPSAPPAKVVTDSSPLGDSYVPREPESLREAGLTPTELEALILKYLLSCGEASGRGIADQVKLPFPIVEALLRDLKYEQHVAYKDAASVNDYVYTLSGMGRERARRYDQECTYYGAAPVPLRDYCEGVRQQSLQTQNPGMEELKQAFSDLLINEAMFARLGPAINSGRGMFLFGYPGNGKTSIAERVTRCFGEYVWIPRCVGVEGEIIRVFDPNHHEEAPLETGKSLLDQSKVDKRWIRIKRPTIIVGGELTMDNLEITGNRHTNINEAPLQMKSNCGTLVIDDFGRQRMSTDQLLNRWIVPLEKRYDFLNLPSGKKIEVPFDQLVIFSTNLEPKDLVDDAFLRRIPYKIEVCDPSEAEYRQLFKIMCPKMGFEYRKDVVDHLVQKHYYEVNRPFRCCQPRDLLLQVRNHCLFLKRPLELSIDYIDFAVTNYFAVM